MRQKIELYNDNFQNYKRYNKAIGAYGDGDDSGRQARTTKAIRQS